MFNTTSDSDSHQSSMFDDKLNFGVTDYAVFIAMLVVSAAVGVYFGFITRSNNTTEEYLLGGREMKVLPIAISLVASQMSALAITSISAEVYSFGITGLFGVLSSIPATLIMTFFLLPIFYENNLSNCYQYIELRFGKLARKLVTVSFLFKVIVNMPIFLFLPSMSFAQVSGYNVHLINCVTCLICVFYTMMGGIKAVVWTDVIQGSIMLITLLVVCILGISAVGGWSSVLENAAAGGRLDFNFDLDLRVRTTVWNNFFPLIFVWCGRSYLNQVYVQRILILPSLQKAKTTLYLAALGAMSVLGATHFLGVIMFARYYGCDPIKTGTVSKPDKIISHFAQDVMGHLAGMPGLFIACIFSAALSTLSANLNTLSGVIYFDCIKPFVKHTELKANRIMKLLVVVLGIFAVVGGYVVQSFSSIFQIVFTIDSLNIGVVVAIFLAGIWLPRINGKVANVAFLCSTIFVAWLIYSNRNSFIQGHIRYDTLPTSVERCDVPNSTTIVNSISTSTMAPKLNNIALVTTAFSSNRPFSIDEVSFQWFKVMGFLVFFIVAIPLSYVCKPDENEVQNPLLFSPLVRSHLKAKDIPLAVLTERQPLNDFNDSKLTNTDNA